MMFYWRPESSRWREGYAKVSGLKLPRISRTECLGNRSRMGTKHLSETMKISAPARRCNRSRTIILRVFTPLFRKKIIGIYHFQPGSLLCTSSDGCEASFCPSEQPASYFSMPRLRLVSDNFEQMELNIRAIVSTTISPDDYGLTGRVSSRSFPRYRRLLVELEHIGWL
jgi:hypothetical protein